MMNVIKNLKYIRYLFLLFAVLVITACSSDEQTKIVLPQEAQESSRRGQSAGEGKETGEPEDAQQTNNPQPENITVYVCGAVNQPGVYTLSGTARMTEAIQAAGGMTAEADPDVLNLAQYMADGQMIRIPIKGEVIEDASNDSAQEMSGSGSGGKIDLNAATAQELQTIPGIGQSKADAIIRYREDNGGFERIEDLMQISGIKEASFQKMEPYICVK